MNKIQELSERFARTKEAATAVSEEERAARDAKTASLRSLRIAEEAKARPPVGKARRHKLGFY